MTENESQEGELWVVTPGMTAFTRAVDEERQRQLARWGDQAHPNGTGEAFTAVLARVVREQCQEAAAEGRLTWQLILLEEVFEALAEADEGALLTELDQVAAVCAAWRWDLTRQLVPDLAETGVDTTGCDCGHLGMSREWHLKWCAWLRTEREREGVRATGVVSPCNLRVRRQPHDAHDWETPEGARWRCRGVAAATPVYDAEEPESVEAERRCYLTGAHTSHVWTDGYGGRWTCRTVTVNATEGASGGDPSSVLSEASLRELYGKAVLAGLRGRETGEGLATTAHRVTTRVLATRDRELRRLRQRLALAASGLDDPAGAAGTPSQHCPWDEPHETHAWTDGTGLRWACRTGTESG